MKIAVIGAGNGGQAIAGHMSYLGHRVSIYDINEQIVEDLNENPQIKLCGALNLRGKISKASCNIGLVVADADIIFVATTATAHKDVAESLASYIHDNQIIILSPGRTCGAIEFKNCLDNKNVSCRYYIAEAQTLVYACRLIKTGEVNIIGVKDRVLMAALPSSDTEHVIESIKPLYSCFYPARNVLETSFENIGAVFHPCVVLFNEATIERGQQFYFYRDMTPGLSHLIESVDNERLAVAHAYGFQPVSAKDWVSYAYNGVEGETLCERIQNNPAYFDILSPTTIHCRQITEDIPTGIIPLSQLGKAAGVPTPIFDSLITMCSTLLDRNFMKNGRTLENLGLSGKDKDQIINSIE